MYFGITFRTYKETASGKQVLNQVLDTNQVLDIQEHFLVASRHPVYELFPRNFEKLAYEQFVRAFSNQWPGRKRGLFQSA